MRSDNLWDYIDSAGSETRQSKFRDNIALRVRPTGSDSVGYQDSSESYTPSESDPVGSDLMDSDFVEY